LGRLVVSVKTVIERSLKVLITQPSNVAKGNLKNREPEEGSGQAWLKHQNK
jgi:hypothetical protein